MSKLTSSSILITFSILLQTALGGDPPLFHFCSSPENFTSNSAYEANLFKLFTDLNYQTPLTGFSKASSGQKPNKPNGLALCRGDVSSSDCKTCLVDATTEIRNRCPYNKAAIIWYDYCLLKYSDVEFFGEIDDRNRFYMWNVRVVSDPATFNRNTKELLSGVVEEAVVGEKLYAVGEVEIGEGVKVYGLSQCTRDLSSGECRKCLDGIVDELPRCCDGKEGGRVVGGSCNFRYEIYPFVKS